MLQSFSKIVSLMLLIVVIATSHVTLFAETDSNSLIENINLTDTNNYGDDEDDSDAYMASIQIIEVGYLCNYRLAIKNYAVSKLLNPLFAIRAPPQYRL